MSNFETINCDALVTVAGGTSSSNSQLTAMLGDISNSIKDAADAKNKSATDPSQMMMMMMMMGGMGGGGGAAQVAAAPPPPAAPTVVKVRV